MFEQTIERFIASHHLLKKDGVYLVALSGGPDSVALLRALQNLGYNIHAAHCNFHLRGAESDRDENFCKSLCHKLNIALHIAHFDTNSYASLHKVSIEMAARELRYKWFAQLNSDINADGVCIAHHQDDQVETVLLNIIRGTGLRGLLGMRPKNGIFLRPMLCVTEPQVTDYLNSLNQDYVIDSTNLQDDAQRNKLRLSIIPLLEKINPAVKSNVIRMTENLADVEAIVNDSLEKAQAAISPSPASLAPVAYASALPKPSNAPRSPLVLSLKQARLYPAPQTLLWSLLSPCGFNRTQVEEISNCKTDNREWKSRDHVAITSRGSLYLISRSQWEQPLPTLRVPEPGNYRYNASSLALASAPFAAAPASLASAPAPLASAPAPLAPAPAPLAPASAPVAYDSALPNPHLRITATTLSATTSIPKEKSRIAIDSATVSFPLLLRPIKPGDRFTPFGMRGSKLVSDYLKDRHRSIIDKHYQLVLTDADDKIIWLVGETIDNHYRISKDSTHILTAAFTTE